MQAKVHPGGDFFSVLQSIRDLLRMIDVLLLHCCRHRESPDLLAELRLACFITEGEHSVNETADFSVEYQFTGLLGESCALTPVRHLLFSIACSPSPVHLCWQSAVTARPIELDL